MYAYYFDLKKHLIMKNQKILTLYISKTELQTDQTFFLNVNQYSIKTGPNKQKNQLKQLYLPT